MVYHLRNGVPSPDGPCSLAIPTVNFRCPLDERGPVTVHERAELSVLVVGPRERPVIAERHADPDGAVVPIDVDGTRDESEFERVERPCGFQRLGGHDEFRLDAVEHEFRVYVMVQATQDGCEHPNRVRFPRPKTVYVFAHWGLWLVGRCDDERGVV